MSREPVWHECPNEVALGRTAPLVEEGPVPTHPGARPLSLGTACRGTLSLERVGSRVRVTALDQVPLDCKPLDDTLDWTHEGDSALTVSGSGRLLARRPDGLVVVLVLEDGHLRRHQEFEIQGESVPPFEEVHVDLAPFIARVEDEWLKALIVSHDVDDTFARVVGLGLFRRYYSITCSREKKREIVLRMLEGGWQHPADEWSRHLTPGQVRTIEDLACAAANDLRREVLEVGETFSVFDPDSVVAWVRVCHERDDLEGVLWLLPQAEALRTVLRELDAAARREAVAIPPGLARHDERLRRAAMIDWEAWWVEPARDPKDFDLPV